MLKQYVPLDIHGLKVVALCDEPHLAEELQGLLRLFLLPEAQPDSWRLSVAVATGNGRGRNGSGLLSGGPTVLVDDRAGRVLVDREAGTIQAEIVPGLAGWATLLVPMLKLLQGSGLFVMHSAAFVDGQGRGYLFPGGHSSGKTTIALTALRLGCRIVADDILPFRARGEELRFLPFFSVLSLEEGNPTKTVFSVLDHYPREVFQGAVNPRLMLFPEITSQARTTVETISARSEVFNRLLAHTLLAEERPHQARQLKILWEMAGRIPAHRLSLGRDHHASPEMLHELLDRMESAGSDDRREVSGS